MWPIQLAFHLLISCRIFLCSLTLSNTSSRSRASSFRWEYPLLPLRSSSSFLHLLPHLPSTSIHPFIFLSITCRRRQFLRKMWPIQLAFRLLISCRIFLLSLTTSNTSSFLTWSVQLIFSILLLCVLGTNK
jgi:hypothetical protein